MSRQPQLSSCSFEMEQGDPHIYFLNVKLEYSSIRSVAVEKEEKRTISPEDSPGLFVGRRRRKPHHFERDGKRTGSRLVQRRPEIAIKKERLPWKLAAWPGRA